MANSCKTIVIGAGICGLSTALAATRAGSSVTLLERAPHIRPLGTAISLWPNALACLSDWGLGDSAQNIGAPFEQVATRHPDGRAIFCYDLATLHQRHGHISRCVTRAALQDLLLSELPSGVLRLGTTAHKVHANADAATVTLEDGTQIEADLVVVADGQNSALRTQIIGETPLRPAGYGAVLGLARSDMIPPGWGSKNEACEYYGPNGRFGVFRSGPGQIYWFFVSSDIPNNAHAQPADIDWLNTALAQWPPFTRDLVAQTAPENMPQVSFHDRAPASHWGKDRILLAGDAAHPMIPNFGQGANQAIEDAYVLGQGIKQQLSGAALAAFYTTQRKARAESLVKQSRQNGQLTQQQNALGKAIRNLMMRKMPHWAITAQLSKQFSGPAADAPDTMDA